MGFQLELKNSTVDLKVQDPSYGHSPKILVAHKSKKENWKLDQSNGWYDFEVTSDQDPDLFIKYAGHIENGKASITDPLMGGENILA